MRLAELCFHLRHRRRMYVFDDRFVTVAGFVEGWNAATHGKSLNGFQDFVSLRLLGAVSPRHWFALIEDSRPDDAARISLMLDLLEEYDRTIRPRE